MSKVLRESRRQCLAALLAALGAVLASPMAAANGTHGPMGCILRQPGAPARFVVAGSLDKAGIARAVQSDRQLRRSPVLDPCVVAQRGALPASVYRALAARHPQRFAALDAATTTAALPGAALQRAPQYQYVAVDPQVPPDFVFFDAAAIGSAGALIGTAYQERGDMLWPRVAVLDRGRLETVADGFASAGNAAGVIGGDLLTDADNFLTQAALFRNGRVEPIPLPDGDIASTLIDLNDRGEALVLSFDPEFNGRIGVWDGLRMAPVDFGPDVPYAFFLRMNNQGLISGTTFQGPDARGFRHDRRSGLTQLLAPLPTEPESWALGINAAGDVLGYSFVAGAIERIGVWDARGVFRTHFVEGTPDVPTISNWLVFNDLGTIVITQVSRPEAERGRSYLVPSPGLRIDLGSLIAGGEPVAGALGRVKQIANTGNLFGSGDAGTFELLRAPR